MFHKMPEASKVCLAKLVEIAQQHNFHFIDCQVPSAHLKSLGACETEREKFLKKLQHSLGSKPESLNWNSIKMKVFILYNYVIPITYKECNELYVVSCKKELLAPM